MNMFFVGISIGIIIGGIIGSFATYKAFSG